MRKKDEHLLTIDNLALRVSGKTIPIRSIAYFEKLRQVRRGSFGALVVPLVLILGTVFGLVVIEENAPLANDDPIRAAFLIAGCLFAVFVLRGLFRLFRRDHYALVVQTSAGDRPELLSTSNEKFMDELVAELTRRLAGREDLPPLIANIQNNTIREGDSIMGDKFQNVSGTIVNRSHLENSLNTVSERMDSETSEALQRIAKLIEAEGNREAAEIFDSLNHELSKEKPAKPVLRSLWEGLLAAMPLLRDATDITAKVIKLF